MTEITPQDLLELFAVGTGVSAAIALIMQRLISPFLRLLVAPVRDVLLRFVPVALGIILTHLLFPISMSFLTPIPAEFVTFRLTIPLGIIAGAGASLAYEMWKSTAKRLLIRWSD